MEPIAWAIKYFTAASVWFIDGLDRIKGIKDRRLISMAVQIKIQFPLERIIRVDKKRVQENSVNEGLIGNIKT